MMGGFGHMVGRWDGIGPNGIGNGFWWMGLIGMLIQLLLWAAIIVLAYRLIRHWLVRTEHGHVNKASGGALEILSQRYARGEISSEEYNRIKQDLTT